MERGRLLHRAYSAERVYPTRNDVRPTDPGALDFLLTADIGEGWLHPNASNYTFVVHLTKDGAESHAVYKPQAGEAPLWDFPSGTLYNREVAAYELSRLLGWNFVPPTAIREAELGVGSMQLYVAPMSDSHYFNLREQYPAEAFRMAVFDLVSNNADRKGGHCFLAQCGGVWGVDHGLTFNVDRKLRTVIWDFAGQPVPRPFLDDLARVGAQLAGHGSEACATLSALLAAEEVEVLRRRIAAVLDRPTMPEPYSRRDLPWPWI